MKEQQSTEKNRNHRKHTRKFGPSVSNTRQVLEPIANRILHSIILTSMILYKNESFKHVTTAALKTSHL